MHNLTHSDFEKLMTSDAARQLSPAARERLSWIAFIAAEHCSISEACERLGISRTSLHRWLDRFDPNDLSSLEEKSHEPHVVRASTLAPEVTAFIRGYREREPLVGKERIRELLLQEHNISLSSSTIGRVIERECLYFASTPLHWKKRMHAGKPAPTVHVQETVMTTPIAAAHTVAPAMTMQESATQLQPASTHHDANHDCFACRLSRMNWHPWRRMLILGSLLANAAIIALFTATVMWEKQTPVQLKADISQFQTITQTSSTLDH
jgi:transposase